MSIAVFLKNNLKNIPPRIGKIINKVPYSKRPGLGRIYNERNLEIRKYELFSNDQKREFILKKMKYLVQYAYSNVPFYQTYYNENGFSPHDLNSFDDIKTIPIINKSILNKFNIEERSAHTKGRYLVNTGGSSGNPFNLYVEPSSMGHEWAHMHEIWSKLNYKPSDLKIVFGGRSDLKGLVEYDVIRNHFAIDIYADYELVSKKLKKILRKYEIKYLHGYPSSIYDFAKYCSEHDKELQTLLSQNLKGVFLGSEYPHEHYRDTIEMVFDVKSISWYGHTERAVLAYEKSEKFKYEPFGTYGFTEALQIDNQDFNLVASSFYNFASPLIRYNTEDTVSEIKTKDGILNSFKIKNGREGEFVLDSKHKKINLTGLIFGRHHEIFNYSKFIQVKQPEIGKIEVYFVSDSLSLEKAESVFDMRNLNLDVSFVKVEEPFRTTSGKVNLLIR